MCMTTACRSARCWSPFDGGRFDKGVDVDFFLQFLRLGATGLWALALYIEN